MRASSRRPGPPRRAVRELRPEARRRMGADRGQGVRAQPLGAPDPARARRAASRSRGCSGSRRPVSWRRVRAASSPRPQVVAMMGGMGRQFDGGYAEYTCVPAASDPVRAASWTGRRSARCPRRCRPRTESLTVGLDAQPGHTLLIRGGTSSVGMTMAVLAKQPRHDRARVDARDAAKGDALRAIGRRRVLIDDGAARGAGARAAARRRGPHARPVGAPTLRDSLRGHARARRRLQQRARCPTTGR